MGFPSQAEGHTLALEKGAVLCTARECLSRVKDGGAEDADEWSAYTPTFSVIADMPAPWQPSVFSISRF